MHMKIEPKGPQAARLRQRKFELLRRFPIPPDCCPARFRSLTAVVANPLATARETRRDIPSGLSPSWLGGKKRVEHIPNEWVEEVHRLVEAGRSLKRPWPRSSPPTPNCWLCGGSRRASEGADARSPAQVHGEVSASEMLLCAPRAMAARRGTYSGGRTGVGFDHGSVAAPGGLCRHRSAGLFAGPARPGGFPELRRRRPRLLHRAARPGGDAAGGGHRRASGQAPQSLRRLPLHRTGLGWNGRRTIPRRSSVRSAVPTATRRKRSSATTTTGPDQCGGNRPDLALGCGTLRPWG